MVSPDNAMTLNTHDMSPLPLSPYKNEANLSLIQALPSCSSDITENQSLHSCDRGLDPARPAARHGHRIALAVSRDVTHPNKHLNTRQCDENY